jgi:WD repeat-containing protein 21A
LAVHHHDSNLVYAGLRNGVVSLEDLRVEPGGVNRVGHTIKGKAVVGVKRLKDSAVPWGMVVSGLDSEVGSQFV